MEEKAIEEVELLSCRIQDTAMALMASFFEKYKISYIELRVIRLCDAHDKMTLNKLSESLNKAAANLSVIVTKLSKSHILKKKISKVDKRITYIEITDKGRKISKESYEHFFDLVNDDLGDELDELIQSLKKYDKKLSSYMKLKI